MVTLIKVIQGNRVVRRCDGRCHNAKGDKCVCCCLGANHGKGHEGNAGLKGEYWDKVAAQFSGETAIQLPLGQIMEAK